MSNLYSGVIGNGNFFCPPKDKRFAPDEMVNLIIQFDEDFKNGNTKYREI